MTNKSGLVLHFFVGWLLVQAISNNGTVAIIEEGSGKFNRLRFLFPDGSSAQPKRIGDLDAVDDFMFTPDESKCFVRYGDDRPPVLIELAKLERRTVANAIIINRPQSCLKRLFKLAVLVTFIIFLIFLGKIIVTSPR